MEDSDDEQSVMINPVPATATATTNNTTNSAPTTKAGKLKELIVKEQRLLRAIAVIVILMNIPYGRYVLYPFILFSTWIHEMCHGMTALMCGGSIASLEIFHDGSGLATTMLVLNAMYNLNRVLVASAGYMGTSIVGGVLLLFRKTTKVAKYGVVFIGMLILFSCALYVRNAFGLLTLLPMGAGLMIGGWFLPDPLVGELYCYLAVTCCLNAVTSIQVLFDTSAVQSDAHSVAEIMLLPAGVFAFLW
eukprot:CAMPEP_0172506764 /NCGR_PEP_ID=MMETSP1066-20121228/198101_1 /TAXON_ID=671091 /ORGANISM="Coscinodiscus wailesii, Strain CCMP2513" /LENGTH=246 /DNA_ID=CAMNT_0013283953 /DNA_START=41 /DNA_END=778 /DNA_ORIENTATION=+